MKFTQATNMGLHVMTYLVQKQSQQNTSIKELADRFQVSPTYLSKILTRLTKANLIASVPGAKGGYRIAQQPEKLTFAMVIEALDGRPDYQDALEGAGEQCEIAETIQTAEEQMWQYLATKRLIDLKQI